MSVGKVLVVTDSFPPKPGGSGRWFWELYRRLLREEIVIAAGIHQGSEDFDRTEGLKIVRMPIRLESWGVVGAVRATAYWRLARQLSAMCREHQAKAIHAGSCFPEGFAAWLVKRMNGTPYLLFVHGEEMRIARGSRELAWMARRVLNGAERLIANSHNTARVLREEWSVPEERISILHPGVDTERFQPAARCLATRERLGWGERRVIMTVGRLQKRKGHDILIRALPAIRNAVPEVLYVIVGDGEERAQLEQLVDEIGVRDQVQFRGESDDKELVECFQQCDLFVLPNREVNGDIEGFGMVLIEAQACGKPVIAGASGGTAETMQVEKTGLVVDCSRPEPLSNAVCRILLDFPRKQQMGKAARQHAIHQFEWQHLTARAAQLLKLRLGSGNGAGPDMESPAAISGRECERQLTSHTA